MGSSFNWNGREREFTFHYPLTYESPSPGGDYSQTTATSLLTNNPGSIAENTGQNDPVLGSHGSYFFPSGNFIDDYSESQSSASPTVMTPQEDNTLQNQTLYGITSNLGDFPMQSSLSMQGSDMELSSGNYSEPGEDQNIVSQGQPQRSHEWITTTTAAQYQYGPMPTLSPVDTMLQNQQVPWSPEHPRSMVGTPGDVVFAPDTQSIFHRASRSRAVPSVPPGRSPHFPLNYPHHVSSQSRNIPLAQPVTSTGPEEYFTMWSPVSQPGPHYLQPQTMFPVVTTSYPTPPTWPSSIQSPQPSASIKQESNLRPSESVSSTPPSVSQPPSQPRHRSVKPEVRPQIASSSRVQKNTSKGLGKSGGRQLGSHLPADVASSAHIMRKNGACWHCVLQRDKCGPGDPCERCRKRALRPNTDSGLGCSRKPLRDLVEFFIPGLQRKMNEPESLKRFCEQHIQQWGGIEITIQLTCGRGFPVIDCQVYVFTPKTGELQRSFHYRNDRETGVLYRQDNWSPPLGIQQMSDKDRDHYEQHIETIVNKHMDNVVSMLYPPSSNEEFAVSLLRLLVEFQPDYEEDVKLLQEIKRLIVTTYILSKVFVISDPELHPGLSKALGFQERQQYPHYCTPRLANRQLKYHFMHLLDRYLVELLSKVQQTFRSSKGADRWTAAFCAVLGLAISLERMQQLIYRTADAKHAMGECNPEEAEREADRAGREIDDKFKFITQIFKWKYCRGSNPLMQMNQEWEDRLRDPKVVRFVTNISQLTASYWEHLDGRRDVPIEKNRMREFTSRLVARFLLSFWHPQ